MKMKRLEKPPKPSAAARTVPIERKSSIETEPRTLSFNQIQSARDAALCVINTKSLEEAFTIFTKGLQPLSVSANAAMRKKGISSTMNSNSVEKNKKA